MAGQQLENLIASGTHCRCSCHANSYASCDQPGGCGANHRDQAADSPARGWCHNLNRCPGWDGKHAEPTDQPYCPACTDRHQRDIRALVYDYLDLAQLHEASLSQAPSEHTSGGGHESPTLLADHIEALQAEIVHALSVWEYELRVDCRLSDPRTYAPLWRRTVYDHLELGAGARQTRPARAGAIVQRAVGIIARRIDRLAALPPTLVCPTGIEDEPAEMAGWEAVQQLADLHGRAKSALGRTTRSFYIPGECWACGARPARDLPGPLYRSEPRFAEDPLEVHCERCRAARPYADYEAYQTGLIWPGQDSDKLVRIAA